MASETVDKPIHLIVEERRADLQTPYYLIDETRLLKNLDTIARVRERSGAKSVLALKCFSTWAVFDLMKRYMDGTTSSSYYEARLGAETFGKEVHAYSVAFSDAEMAAVHPLATKIILNSRSQLERFYPRIQDKALGIRVNPGVSHSHFDLADPARPYSRLGVSCRDDLDAVIDRVSGLMFHCQCENDELESFSRILDHIEREFGAYLSRVKWVSLGGGIYFTKSGYPLDVFIRRLSAFADRFGVQVYLEPGESAITQSGYLVTQVLDVVQNGQDIAIVDAAVETHMLDLLIYRSNAKIDGLPATGHTMQVAGRTCLAGDVFGTYAFPAPLRVGDRVAFADAAGYTMVKKNWFNGVAMPSIAVRRLDGRIDVVRQFSYDDYRRSLS